MWKDSRLGVPLLLESIPPQCEIDNYSSINENIDFVKETLEKWEHLGVYQEVHDKPHVISPLGVAEKDGKKRLVVDATASGLNDHLVNPSFHLPTHSDIIRGLYKDDHLCKADFQNGFLQLPVREVERTFLGFFHPIKQKYCVFIRLPFGLGPGTFLFHTFSTGVKCFFTTVFRIDLEAYIDDWLLKHSNKEGAAFLLDLFHEPCAFLGIAINPEKSEGPDQVTKFLRLLIDSHNCQLRLPEDKRMKYLNSIEELLSKETCTMDDLTKTAGRLVHVQAVHKTGWTHIQALWAVIYADKKCWTRRQLARTYLAINDDTQIALQWWLKELQHPLQRNIWCTATNQLFLWDCETAKLMPSVAITITTDACSLGWGASLGTLTSRGTWTAHQVELSNNWRETKAVINAMHSWSFVQGKPILCFTDNSTAVAVVNRRNPQAMGLQMLVDDLNDVEKQRKTELVAIHLPGKLNDLADSLSRDNSIVTADPLKLKMDQLQNLNTRSMLVGIQEVGMRLPRFTLLPLKNNFLIVCSVPDIPFLIPHLCRAAVAKPDIMGWILMPRIPTSELPFRGTVATTHLPPLLE